MRRKKALRKVAKRTPLNHAIIRFTIYSTGAKMASIAEYDSLRETCWSVFALIDTTAEKDDIKAQQDGLEVAKILKNIIYKLEPRYINYAPLNEKIMNLYNKYKDRPENSIYSKLRAERELEFKNTSI
jgi:Fe-S-cluster formation regulator IscX/YfhJ